MKSNFLIVFLTACLLLSIISRSASGQNIEAQQTECSQGLINGFDNDYSLLNFSAQTIQEMTPCMREETPEVLRIQAVRLVALCNYYLNEFDVYQGFIVELIAIDSEFAPPDDDPAFFKEDVAAERSRILSQNKRRPILWIGLGAVGAASTVVALLGNSGGGKDKEPFGPPPGDPVN